MLSDTAAAGYNAAGQYQQVANFEHYHSYQQHLQQQQQQQQQPHQAQVATGQAYQHSAAGPQLMMHHTQHFHQQHGRDVSGRGLAGSAAPGEPVSASLSSTGAHPFHPAGAAAAIQTHQHHQHPASHQYHQYQHQRHGGQQQQQQQLAGANPAPEHQVLSPAGHLAPAHPHAAASLHPQHQHQAHIQQAGQQQFQFHPHLGHHAHHLHHRQPAMMTPGAVNSSTSPYNHNQTPPSQYPHQAPAVGHYAPHLSSAQHAQHHPYAHTHTTPPFGSQPAGSMMALGSPHSDTIAEMSPVLMKQDPLEQRLAIQTEQMEQSLKKASQLEQLHQQCASLLDDQQHATLVGSGAARQLIASGQQHPDSKLAPSEATPGAQTPSSIGSNSAANNINANTTDGRSKRPSPYGHNQTPPSQYSHHQEHQQHSAVGHYAQHLSSHPLHNPYGHTHTTPPFGGQPPGSMMSLSSPNDSIAEMSPVLMKQEAAEASLAIQTDLIDQSLKKESQLEQLHQRCASLLDEQQRTPLVSSGGAQHLVAGNQQHADSKLGSNEPNSGTQTPTSANINSNSSNNNSNNNNNANNNNGGSTNGRSKRLRTSFKHHQLKEMKKWFSKNQNPDAKDLKTLAQTTGLSKRVLQVWFQNARAKFRRNNAKAVSQQMYNVNQHTSHMLQFQQQQAPHHPIHTYGQQHHLNQHTLITHHHHNHHQQQQQQSHLHGPAVSSANVVVPIAMSTSVRATSSDSNDHTTLSQASAQTAQSQARPHNANSVVTAGDGCINSYAQLDTD